MKESNKCPNCGATIKYNEDKSVGKCPYCNSTFDGDNADNHTFDRKTATIKDLQIDEDELLGDNPHKINILLLVVLFVINPLFAMIYLIVKTTKKIK